eukprot:2740388-Amphidinium_carterae.1
MVLAADLVYSFNAVAPLADILAKLLYPNAGAGTLEHEQIDTFVRALVPHFAKVSGTSCEDLRLAAR